MADSDIDLSRYEQLGDISAPFQVTKKHERRQHERTLMLEGMHCDVPPLTWEQYQAGEPCPGCRLPYRDEEPFENKGTMYFTPEHALATTPRTPAGGRRIVTATRRGWA